MTVINADDRQANELPEAYYLPCLWTWAMAYKGGEDDAI